MTENDSDGADTVPAKKKKKRTQREQTDRVMSGGLISPYSIDNEFQKCVRQIDFYVASKHQ